MTLYSDLNHILRVCRVTVSNVSLVTTVCSEGRKWLPDVECSSVLTARDRMADENLSPTFGTESTANTIPLKNGT
jgi:hypothetical protein